MCGGAISLSRHGVGRRNHVGGEERASPDNNAYFKKLKLQYIVVHEDAAFER